MSYRVRFTSVDGVPVTTRPMDRRKAEAFVSAYRKLMHLHDRQPVYELQRRDRNRWVVACG